MTKRLFIILLVFTFLGGSGFAQDDLVGAIRRFKQSDFAGAKKAFQALAKQNPKSPEISFYLGRHALIDGDTKGAIEFFERAVKLAPKNGEYHFWLGRTLGLAATEANPIRMAMLAKKVKSEFETAVKLDPTLIDARFGLLDFYMMAPGLMGGSEEKAMEQAAEIRKLDPMRGHSASASIYRRQKKQDLVEKEYAAAIAAFPKDPLPRIWLSNYYSGTSDYDRARQQLEAALNVHPDSMAVQFQIGRLAALSGKDLERGEAMLKTYLKYTPKEDEPSIAAAHYRLGGVYEKQGKKDLARQHYAIALKAFPKSKEIAEAHKRVS